MKIVHQGRLGLLLGLSLGGLSGCAAGPRAVPGGVVSLEVRAQIGEEPEWRCVTPGQTLHTGDRLALMLSSSQPVHFYTARVAGKDQVDVLLESAAPALAAQVPEAGSAIRLDSQAGAEDIRVVASRRPLSHELVRQRIGAEQVRDPPPAIAENKRACPAVSGQLDADGTTQLRFALRHE